MPRKMFKPLMTDKERAEYRKKSALKSIQKRLAMGHKRYSIFVDPFVSYMFKRIMKYKIKGVNETFCEIVSDEYHRIINTKNDK